MVNTTQLNEFIFDHGIFTVNLDRYYVMTWFDFFVLKAKHCSSRGSYKNLIRVKFT